MTSKPDNREVWQAGPWGGGDRQWAVYDPQLRTIVTGLPRQLAIDLATDHNQAQLVERLRAALVAIADDGAIHRDAEACRYDACSCAAVYAAKALAELREGDA